MAHVVVIGSTNTDMFVVSERLPAPGETVLGGDFYTAAGGKGANQAVAAARAGARVSFVAKIGGDPLGAETVDRLKADGIDTSHLSVDADSASGVALIMVDGAGENLIAVAPGANGRLSPGDVDAARDVIAGADYVLLQLEIPLDTVRRAVSLAREEDVPVVLNPSPVPSEDISDIACSVAVLVPNRAECAAILGTDVGDVEQTIAAAEDLVRRGAGAVAATLGPDGAVVSREGASSHVPGFSVGAVDTVGAGDTFSGYLAACLAEGAALEDAVHRAQAAAALSVTRPGAQPAIPRRGEVDEFMKAQGRP
jgi:ribokinase